MCHLTAPLSGNNLGVAHVCHAAASGPMSVGTLAELLSLEVSAAALRRKLHRSYRSEANSCARQRVHVR
jgi:hypothetical protein